MVIPKLALNGVKGLARKLVVSAAERLEQQIRSLDPSLRSGQAQDDNWRVLVRMVIPQAIDGNCQRISEHLQSPPVNFRSPQ